MAITLPFVLAAVCLDDIASLTSYKGREGDRSAPSYPVRKGMYPRLSAPLQPPRPHCDRCATDRVPHIGTWGSYLLISLRPRQNHIIDRERGSRRVRLLLN